MHYAACAPVTEADGSLRFEPPSRTLFTENDTNNERLCVVCVWLCVCVVVSTSHFGCVCRRRSFSAGNETPYVKDAFHRFFTAYVASTCTCARIGPRSVAHTPHDRFRVTSSNDEGAVNPDNRGTKAAPVFRRDVAPGQAFTVWVRLSDTHHDAPFEDFGKLLVQRRDEADEFYDRLQELSMSADDKLIQRQAFAGLLWSKQFYVRSTI